MNECNCRTFCRIPDIETEDGKYPMPEHSPSCNAFKTLLFKRVSCEGTSFICEPVNLNDCVEGLENFNVDDVHLTQDQFDKIAEFEGF